VLTELIGHLIGTMILLSLAVTLMLYVRFKRHQKNRYDSFTFVSGYGAALFTIIVFFGVYINALTPRVRAMFPTPQMMYENYFAPDREELIDSRPFILCGESGTERVSGVCSEVPRRTRSYSIEDDESYLTPVVRRTYRI